MKENIIRKLLNKGAMTLGTRTSATWPYWTELIGFTNNFDYVEYVAEYSPYSQNDLENLVRAAELHNMGSIIKVDFYNAQYVAQKAAASGFQGILFTDVHNAEEVRQAIYSLTPDSPEYRGHFGYPTRRFIGFQPFMKQMDHAKRVNDLVLAFMIEKQTAVNEIDEICSIPGVDMVQFGPSDFAMSCGHNLVDYRKEASEAEKKVIETALKHGVRPRAEVYGDPEDIEKYLALGVKDIVYGDDIKVYRKFLEEKGSEARQIVNDLRSKN